MYRDISVVARVILLQLTLLLVGGNYSLNIDQIEN